MFSSILVPVDGSEPSVRAAMLAAQLARLTNARLLFAHVIETDKVVLESEAPIVDPDRVEADFKSDGEEILKKALETPGLSGLEVTTEQIDGEPVPQIIELSDAHGCDLIVMGSHGRRGLSRMLLGSVTEGVLRHSHVPVLCIRADDN